MSTEIKKVAKRTQISHRKIFDEGKTIYEYDYEIVEPNGKTYKKQFAEKFHQQKFLDSTKKKIVKRLLKQ